MQTGLFYYFGKFIYHSRWLIILVWLILVLACIPFAPKLMESFKSVGFLDPHSESARTNDFINKNLGFSYNQFLLIYSSDKWLATQPEFQDEIKKSLAKLKNIKIKHQIILPTVENKQISSDKKTAYVIVTFKGNQEVDISLLEKFKSNLTEPKNLSMLVGGEPIFLDDTKQQTQRDLFKAEYIAGPVAIITMLIVFGSVVAASLPIVLGGISAFIILSVLSLLGHFFSLSVFTINIALLLGLCLSLDYALLIVNRYRDELAHKHHPAVALGLVQATAGKAVFFSGLIVFISLSALLFFPIKILFSVGVGGLVAVFVSVAVANLLLPAVLAVLDKKINLLPIRSLKLTLGKQSFWHRLVVNVIRRPFLFFFLTLFILLGMSYPFLHVKYGISDFRILPKTLESRRVFDNFQEKFGENRLAPIQVLIKTPEKNILTKTNIDSLYDFADKIIKDKRVDQITGIVSTKPRLSKDQYKLMYTSPTLSNSPLNELIKNTTHDNFTIMTVTSKYPGNTAETNALIQKIRDTKIKNNMTVQLTGSSVNTVDVLNSISHIFPYAVLWIVVCTYIILLILLHSVILPLKAILTTILSVCASYGILVLVFQEGYLHQLLHFEPQGMLDISLLIIIFCALFGISMDYEVFILTRIKEYYEQTNDTIKGIEFGIERSSRIITSAALIVIVLCFSFMAADVLIVKAFGLGIAIAVFVDAFIIRAILVPATMTILNQWNWYLPKTLNKILPRISFDEET